MSRGMHTSADSRWAYTWADTTSLAYNIMADTRLPSGLSANLTAAQAVAVARGFSKPEEDGMLIAALKHVLTGKQV